MEEHLRVVVLLFYLGSASNGFHQGVFQQPARRRGVFLVARAFTRIAGAEQRDKLLSTLSEEGSNLTTTVTLVSTVEAANGQPPYTDDRGQPVFSNEGIDEAKTRLLERITRARDQGRM